MKKLFAIIAACLLVSACGSQPVFKGGATSDHEPARFFSLPSDGKAAKQPCVAAYAKRNGQEWTLSC